MSIEVVVPRLGWSMDEGVFGEWLVADGEVVKPGDRLFMLEGEKASQEIESFDSGVLHIPSNGPAAGDTVAVGQVLGFLLDEGESPPASGPKELVTIDLCVDNEPGRTSGARITVSDLAINELIRSANINKPIAIAAPVHRGGPAARRRARVSAALNATATTAFEPNPNVPVDDAISSPRARRRARELGIDWTAVTGSGRDGRVRERDVADFATQRDLTPRGVIEPDSIASGRAQITSRIRRTIAQRMLAGLLEAAPVTLTTRCEAANLVAFRNRWKQADNEVVPSYADLILKLVAAALPSCPEMNACWRDNDVFVYDEVNIAVAVDTPAGLMAPVIRGADRLTLSEIACCSQRLSERARAGSLTQNQLVGGTFTITNLGGYGIDFFTPIINLPQAAVLGIGAITREPIVRGDSIEPAEMLSLSLTFDHRVLDGAPAARWLQGLCEQIRDLNFN